MTSHQSQPLPPILLKPTASIDQPVYRHFEMGLNATISIHPLDISRDIEMIHDWVNQSYSRRFWQLSGSRQMLINTYEGIIAHPRAHSFIVRLEGHPIAQVDVYGIVGEELHSHADTANEFDCGVHLLMLPTKDLQKRWSLYTLKNFQRYYFSFPQHNELFAEPDQANALAYKLAKDAGFRFVKTIELSNKTANLFSIKRDAVQ